MRISEKGLEFLERHEGVVLKAYRDAAGVLTIGAGLTAASGVIKPRPGMIITAKQASQFLDLALRRNYEPAVGAAMPGAAQQEFDGGVSFHFNTGAIKRATWVPHWRRKDWSEVRRRLAAWNKGGGRVLPGLTRRREEEYRLIRHGDYGKPARPRQASPLGARIVLDLSQTELREAVQAFIRLGYLPKGTATLTGKAVERFQADHDLTVDGIVGRATLSTLQRRIDAARKTRDVAVGTTGSGGAGMAADGAGYTIPELWWLILLGLLAAWAAWIAFRYRDVIAAKVERRMPRLAARLRSF